MPYGDKERMYETPLGIMSIDTEGAPIAGVRMDVTKTYTHIPLLLQHYINTNDSSAWAKITVQIDYLYSNLAYALDGLDRGTGFGGKVQEEVRTGKKLVFKPNLINPLGIEQAQHGEGPGVVISTEWPLIAALMRLFHDKLEISYYQMALGEASTDAFVMSDALSAAAGRKITTEAVFEGRSGEFYAGWGFYFIRKYLTDRHPDSHTDHPMNGYEDSIAGRYFPPGNAGERLMVYDLNKLHEDIHRGRSIAVPDGANYPEITLHKVIVGGDPLDPNDRQDYPGCVLVNVPKLKIHAQDLITCALKNLGIGLYPSQCAAEDQSWKYAYPSKAHPNLKGKLPHSPWMLAMDEHTHLPVKDENGNYIATKTAGMSGTQADILRAVQSQNVFMVHVVDAINIDNISHDTANAVRVPEGYLWFALDCVAVDLFCARYCFKTVPMAEAFKLKEENNWPTEFVHQVPVARRLGTQNITTEPGYDSPLFRYDLYRYAEARGVGQQQYYLLGWDSLTQTPLASVNGHLGRIENGTFLELITRTLYYNPFNIIHSLQKTILSYAQAHDGLTGSGLFAELMERLDENHDGIIDFDEKGRNGDTTPFGLMGYATGLMGSETYGQLKGGFITATVFTKYSNPHWNAGGHDFTKELEMQQTAAVAYELSTSPSVSADRFIPGMTYGGGMWPSWQTATYTRISRLIYGIQSPDRITLGSLYGLAFQYADKIQNGGLYTGSTNAAISDPESLNIYFKALAAGAAPLNFTLYVPRSYASLDGVKVPNVEETEDPGRIFTVQYQEAW